MTERNMRNREETKREGQRKKDLRERREETKYDEN